MYTKVQEALNAVQDVRAALVRLPLLVNELVPVLEQVGEHTATLERSTEQLAAKEAELARREELVANRERQLAEREANSDERERTLAALAADLKRQQQAATVARR